MLGNWKNWCRLCAKINSSCDESVHKLESIADQLEIVNKHFTLSLVPMEGVPSAVCEECLYFLTKLENYGNLCERVDQMFRDLILRKNTTDADLQSIRFVYRIDNEEIKYSTVLSEDRSESPLKETDPDPLDSEDEDYVPPVKEEIEELPDVRKTRKKKRIVKKVSQVLRKRGRPRKSAQQIVIPTAEIKQETKLNDFEEDSLDIDDTMDYVPEELQDETNGTKARKSQKRSKNSKTFADKENVCEICSMKFCRRSVLKDHILEQHRPEDLPHKCSKCSKRFISKYKLRIHESTHLSEAERRRQNECEFCSKKFCRRSVLKDHILEQHRPEDLPHICSKCSKRFISKYKLKVHESTHLSEEERRNLPCPYCDKKFAKKFILQSHIHAMHIGDKPYVCEECGNSFRTISALNQHQTIHSDERPFQCASCPKKFKKTQHLKRHEESHMDKMYECPHCDLKLKTSRTLRMHLLVHSDDKKYKCHYCGNEYKRSKTLKDHLILHTGQRPYECPFCEKTFANNSNCRSHKRKAHPVELAALEASGEQPMRTVVPKLEHLQPKQSSSTDHLDIVKNEQM